MAGISIIAVSTAAQMTSFIELPWAIYRDFPLWVPPLKQQERTLLTPGKHPYWENAERELLLALRGGKVIGRIAAIVDHNHNATAQECCGAWGFFECYNDPEAAHALFDATRAWLQERGCTFLRGPLNPSTNYTCAMLVDGFDLPPAIMMPWNPPYYPELAESWHMRKEQDLFAYSFNKNAMKVAPEVRDQIDFFKNKNEFTYRVSSKSTLTDDIRTMLDIYQQSWADNWGFTPMPLAEAENHIKDLKSVLDTDFFVLFFHKGQPAGGMLALPDMNPLLKRCNGSLGLTTPWHYWRVRKQLRQSYRLVLFGIKAEYRLMGLPLLLLDFMFDQAQNRPEFSWVEGSWSLEDNVAINDLIEDFGGVLTKRYRIYRREMDS
ncbi:MAG: hypothetical protein RRY29_03050 [Desulfovibrionaceae bacterium]